jgi:hypothetical protein
MLSGFYGDYVRLLTPARSGLEAVRVNGREVGAEEVGLEAGKASFGRYLPLPRDATASLEFTYEVPRAVRRRDGTHEYRLLVQKQPGSVAMPLSIALSVPDGTSLRSVSLDGEELDGAPATVEMSLDRDRELVVVYR